MRQDESEDLVGDVGVGGCLIWCEEWAEFLELFEQIYAEIS